MTHGLGALDEPVVCCVNPGLPTNRSERHDGRGGLQLARFSHRRPTRCRIASDRADWLVRDQQASKSTLIGFGCERASRQLYLWSSSHGKPTEQDYIPDQYHPCNAANTFYLFRIHFEGADRRDNPIVAPLLRFLPAGVMQG